MKTDSYTQYNCVEAVSPWLSPWYSKTKNVEWLS